MIIMKKIYFTLIALLASINMFAQGWPANYSGVMLQGFSWDSYDYSQWSCSRETSRRHERFHRPCMASTKR